MDYALSVVKRLTAEGFFVGETFTKISYNGVNVSCSSGA